jgi:membrane-bound ClpP family serine protease
MSNKSPKDSKSYQTAAMLFSISGLIFIILGVVSGKIGIYLSVGIALVIISIVFSNIVKSSQTMKTRTLLYSYTTNLVS